MNDNIADMLYITNYLGIPTEYENDRDPRHKRLCFKTYHRLTVVYELDYPEFWAYQPDAGLLTLLRNNIGKC